MPDPDDGRTDSAQTRWAYTNDLLAFIIILAFIGILAAPLTPLVASHEGINPYFAGGIFTGFGVAITWAFGPETVRAWQEAKGGDS